MSETIPTKPDYEKMIRRAFDQKMDALFKAGSHMSTVASGALAFTAAFTDMPKNETANDALLTSWVCFIACILGFTLLYYSQIRAYAAFVDGVCSESSPPLLVKPVCHFYIALILLNVGFVAGMGALIVFGCFRYGV